MKQLNLQYLASGGLITNYYCSSRCGHCLYGCGPEWDKKYIDYDTAVKNMRAVKNLGCASLHIGGGEPFLNRKGLETVLKAARGAGMNIEYVETNSSWYHDPDSASLLLESLSSSGLSTLLISMDPFHNEYIPFFKVKGVMEACKKTGINVFPWIADFYPEIDTFDDKKTHKMAEYISEFGGDYLKTIPSRLWIRMGGRALSTFSKLFRRKNMSEIFENNREGCRELEDAGHFHVDLFGNYIPGLCSGISIPIDDLGRPISEKTYPFLAVLYESGISGFRDLASEKYGFKGMESYISKCHLCMDIRRYLVIEKNIKAREFQPRDFYEKVDL
jgi:organic radical activating enzyme